jgi:hypothetical protein
MYRLIQLFLLCFCLLVQAAPLSAAWSSGEKPLLVIDGVSYTAQDFKEWWRYWRDEGAGLPANPEVFVDWLLLVNEAERLELSRSPAYQRKVEAFLKVRALLMLKSEEVDAKIVVTEGLLRDHYQKEYSPRLHLQLLFFNDRRSAEQAVEELRSGQRDMEYFKSRPDVFYEEQILRPQETTAVWRDVLSGMAVGGISDPLAWGEGFRVFRLQSRIWFDDEDFTLLRTRIGREVRKQEEVRLANAMVESLKERYRVRINRQLLAGVDLYTPESSKSESALVRTDKQVITVRQFVEQVSRRRDFLQNHGADPVVLEGFKNRALEDMLAQSLTSWTALDRHFEKEPPLQAVYQFYIRNQLVKDLEKQLLEEIPTLQDEIVAYYGEHRDEFAKPATVQIAVVKYAGELIDQIWAEIISGVDFTLVAEKYTGRTPVVGEQPLTRIPATLKAVISKLKMGEVGKPFYENGEWNIIKLVARQPAMVQPLEAAGPKIREILRRKVFEERKAESLEQLKARAIVSINDQVWRQLREEL